MAKQQRNPMAGIIYISRNTTENPKAPYVKGFVSITPELLAALSDTETDSYGNYKLDVSLWVDENKPGVLKGKIQLPYALRVQEEEQVSKPAPKNNKSRKPVDGVSDDELAF